MNKLLNPVLKQTGVPKHEHETLIRDIYNHGAEQGVPGFTYYKDCTEFYRKYRKLIIADLKEQAAETNESVIKTLYFYRTLSENHTMDEIAETLFSNNSRDWNYYIICNIVWYIVEKVAWDYLAWDSEYDPD